MTTAECYFADNRGCSETARLDFFTGAAKIYWSAKFPREARYDRRGLGRDLSFAALEIDVDDYYERTECGAGRFAFSNAHTTISTDPRWLHGGPAGQLPSFAPTLHRSRLIGLSEVNRKSRLELPIRGS